MIDEVRMMMGSVWAKDCDGCGARDPNGGWMIGVATIDEHGRIERLRTYSLACYAEECGLSPAAVELFADSQNEMRRALTEEAREEAEGGGGIRA